MLFLDLQKKSYMDQILRFLQAYEIWIYLFLGVVGIFYLQSFIRSWTEWRSAIFGLEKENAQRKLSAAISILALLFFLAAAEFILISFVMPAYPTTAMLLTPTLDLFATPTITLSPGMNLSEADLSDATPVPLSGGGCVAGQIEWNRPAPQEQVSGAVELYATINIPDLGYYKYEVNQSGTDVWEPLAGGNTVKNNELIGTWNTESRVPGDYRLRLIVHNSQDQELAPCELSLQVAPVQ